MSFEIIIPARYASGRLPGKPLLDIAGKAMINHVIDNALASQAQRVILATDDERIAKQAEGTGVTVCMTAVEHNSGTERIAEVINKFDIADDTILVNLQGDEPLMPTECLNQVGTALENEQAAQMATLSARIESGSEMFDPHCVKLTVDKNNYALYFSRAAIPWHQADFANGKQQLTQTDNFYRHIGLYAYRAKFVRQYVSWGSCVLEEYESLEQLRVLYNGYKIKVIETPVIPGPGVNTPEELARVTTILLNRNMNDKKS